MKSMFKSLSALVCAFAITASSLAQAPITKISQYPEATSVDGTELFILAVTNQPTGTNKNMKLSNAAKFLQPFMTNLTPNLNSTITPLTSYNTGTNNLAAYARSLTNGFYGNELTNGLAGLNYVVTSTNTLAAYARGLTNGFVGIQITNGLAGLNYVVTSTNTLAGYARGLTNGFVGPEITNGLAGLNYVMTSTNTLAGYARGLTNGFVGPAITNGLASIQYVDSSIAGVSGSGISSLNGLSGISQTLQMETNSALANPRINSSGTAHTWQFPDASATARGLLAAADYTTFNNKPSNSITNGLAGIDLIGNFTTNTSVFPAGNQTFGFGNTPVRTATNGVSANTTYTFTNLKAGTYCDLLLMGSTVNANDYTTTWVFPANTLVLWLNGVNATLTHAKATQFAFKVAHVATGTNIVVAAWKESTTSLQ